MHNRYNEAEKKKAKENILDWNGGMQKRKTGKRARSQKHAVGIALLEAFDDDDELPGEEPLSEPQF